MTKCKWTKFYPSDFLTGIHGMCAAEVTTYIIVLCELYDHEGSCPRDDARMADRCIMRQWEFTKYVDRLIAKGKLDFYAGRLTNKRVSEEIENRLESALKKAASRTNKQSLMKQPASNRQAPARQSESRKPNQINGNVTHVLPHIELREDKKESFLEVSTLHEEALEEARRRSAESVAEALKRRAERTTKKPTFLKRGATH
jgi:uncharacterized protein YdaU (DUF1376 family)